jgi:acyl-CoA thioester hydrolase
MAFDTAELLRTSHHTLHIPVAWGEMDALGHVNNTVYFRYLESARIAALRSLGLTDVRSHAGVGFILQHVACRFRRPVHFPDTLAVTARLTSLGQDRFTLAHEVISTALTDVAAIGEGTIVTYDYRAASKVPIPSDLYAVLKRLLPIADGSPPVPPA